MINLLIFETDVNKAKLLHAAINTVFTYSEEGAYDARIHAAIHADYAIKLLSDYHFDIVFVNIDSIEEAQAVSKAFRKHDMMRSLVYHGGDTDTLCRLLPYRPSAYLPNVEDVKYAARIALLTYHEQYRGVRFITFMQRNENIRIPVAKIEFLESQSPKVIVHKTDGETEEFYGTLDDIEEKVSNQINQINFVRCHKSYLVNLDNIRLIDMKNSRFIAKSEKPIYMFI